MKAASKEKPDWYWLRKIEEDTAYLRIRWNIEEKQVEEEEGIRAEYNYDEEELAVTIPEILTVTKLKDYLRNEKTSILNKAKGLKEERDKPKTPQEETIKTMDINKLREELKK